MDERERHRAGIKVRSEVLERKDADSAEASANAFDDEFQDLLTRYTWGEIWNSPVFSFHTRSLLTIGLLVALNRSEELPEHLRAALKHGVTAEEIRETLLHCAVYCGFPAANAAFRTAKQVLTRAKAAK